MKQILMILFFCSFFSACSEVKDKANMSKYRGAVLLSRRPDWRVSAPTGAYMHTFRFNDSIWSESFMYGVFANFGEGDTLK